MDKKNQEKTLWSGMFILMSGGMKMVESMLQLDSLGSQVSWFAGCIIGAFLGGVLVRFVPKKIPFIIAGALVIVGGIICTSLKTSSAIAASNWLDGLAFGMTVLMFIIVAGENSDSNKRGAMVSIEALAVSTGILIFTMIQTIFAVAKVGSSSFTVVQTQGILSIIFGLAACVLGFFFFIETPVYHLMKGDQNEAINAITALNNETSPSIATSRFYEELKEYVHYDESKSIQQHIVDGLVPLAKITVVRVFMTLTIIPPASTEYFIATFAGYRIDYGMIFFGLSRFIGVFIGQLALIDKIGRKKTLAICSLVIGILFIVIGSMADNFLKSSNMITVATLIIISSFFCGMSQNVSSVYFSEAFPPSIKSGMIFAGIFIENIVVIIVFAALQDQIKFNSYFIVVGVFQIMIAVMAVTLLPETKHLTLQRAMEFLQGLLNIGF